MKTLLAEDDLICRTLLLEFLRPFGSAHVAVTGREAIHAVRIALEAREPYDLVCLDIGMPEGDGLTALATIRQAERAAGVEREKGAKVLMISALSDRRRVLASLNEGCDGFIVKPVDKARLLQELSKLGIMDAPAPIPTGATAPATAPDDDSNGR